MVLWPFQTMREIEVLAPSRATPAPTEFPHEWVAQLRALNPKYLVPSSCQFLLEDWSWYNRAFFPISYRQFENELAQALPQTRVLRLDPSASVSLGLSGVEAAPNLNWVTVLGKANQDYEYDPDLSPPSTAAIAKRFPALSVDQTDAVYAYCSGSLMDKFRSLEPSCEEYFLKARHWRLTLYNHLGGSRDFYYLIHSQEIEVLEKSEPPIAWCTEVPLYKLHTALTDGESLTSMYVRINDLTFAPEVECEIGNADPVEDPLIRCLFTRAFGSYQLAQLERLKLKSSLRD